jgi:hypothetical protein
MKKIDDIKTLCLETCPDNIPIQFYFDALDQKRIDENTCLKEVTHEMLQIIIDLKQSINEITAPLPLVCDHQLESNSKTNENESTKDDDQDDDILTISLDISNDIASNDPNEPDLIVTQPKNEIASTIETVTEIINHIDKSAESNPAIIIEKPSEKDIPIKKIKTESKKKGRGWRW